MMAVKVKICGITNEEDAVWAANLGAHYLGLNLHKDSPRKVSPDVAERIATKAPPFVTTVGVFVEQGPEEIVKIVREVGLRGVQLHGDHTPEDARAVAEQAEVALIRAVRVAEEEDLEAIAAFGGIVSYVLLDAKVGGLAGGTGASFPWALAAQATSFGLPLFLAGGSPPRMSAGRRARCGPSPWTWPRAWSNPPPARTSTR